MWLQVKLYPRHHRATAPDAGRPLVPWCREINWDVLLARAMVPPINPDTSRASDCKYVSQRYLPWPSLGTSYDSFCIPRLANNLLDCNQRCRMAHPVSTNRKLAGPFL
jgi:hypothetical protein